MWAGWPSTDVSGIPRTRENCRPRGTDERSEEAAGRPSGARQRTHCPLPTIRGGAAAAVVRPLLASSTVEPERGAWGERTRPAPAPPKSFEPYGPQSIAPSEASASAVRSGSQSSSRFRISNTSFPASTRGRLRAANAVPRPGTTFRSICQHALAVDPPRVDRQDAPR